MPMFIKFYNMYMHAVDVVDQLRKFFGVDMQNATRKYTVRVFEILWSMILTQSYNVYRCVHRNTPSRQLTHIGFKVAVFRGMMKHSVVCGGRFTASGDEVFAVWRNHNLIRTPIGSRGDGSNRRLNAECRNCPNTAAGGKRKRDRKTSYYCVACGIFLHPECHIPYHERLQALGGSPPARKIDLGH